MTWEAPRVGARATWTRTVTAGDVELYTQITGDRNPLHFDPRYAAATSFGRPVVQGGIGDTVTAEAEVIEARADKPITRLRCVATRQDGVEVFRGECLVYTLRPPG